MSVYDVLVVEEYESSGQKKAAFHKVGSAFDPKTGAGLNVELVNGVALTGRFIIRPRKDRQAGASAEPAMAEEIQF